MENLLYNISQVLGITIIHSLWQGLLIYCVLRGVLLSAPSLSSVKKYNLSAIALLSMAGWFVYTFCTEAVAYDWHPSAINYVSPFFSALNLHAISRPDLKTTLYDSIKTYLPYVSIIYAIGLVVNLGRLGLAWNKIRIIKKGMIYAENLQQRINEFSRQLNISRQVKVGYSRLVDVPCVIGYFKPILLLPVTLIFQLSAEEIETVLLHELSHIKGNDFLVNLVQQIISVLLFFNPFAQFISNIISTERENRCDDIVVQKVGSRLTYAHALLKLEEVRQSELKLALAATQNKHHLLNRIERIMKTETPIGNIRPILLAVLLIAASMGSIAWLNPEIKNGKLTLKNITAPAKVLPPAAPVLSIAKPITPAKNRISISYDTIHNSQLTDTNKKKAKIKIVVEDENGNKHEYNSVNDMPQSVKDEFYKNNDANFNFGMNFNLADSGKWKEAFKQFNSAEWKKQMAEMDFNSAKWKDQMETMSKQFNSPEWKKQMEDMSKQFNSPEWKKQMEDMSKQFNSPEWKKQMEDMSRQFNSADWKKQMEDMQKQFNSADWKKQMEDMQKSFNSPEWKKQVEDMQKYGVEMEKYFNSPEWRQRADDKARMTDDEYARKYGKDEVPENMKASGKKPAVNKKQTTKKVPTKTEAKEKTEKSKKKEATEKPEKKEAPENPEAYNLNGLQLIPSAFAHIDQSKIYHDNALTLYHDDASNLYHDDPSKLYHDDASKLYLDVPKAPGKQGAYNKPRIGVKTPVYLGVAQIAQANGGTLYSLWKKPGC